MTDQAKVGLMVVVSAAILLTAVFYMTGLGLGTKYVGYKTYLNFAGGLEPGTPVRFGGLKVGRVTSVGVSSEDVSRIEIGLALKADVPLPTDSVAGLSQLGLLGENYVEIQPGKAPETLQPGSTIPSVETQDLAALMRRMNVLAEEARPLVADLHKNLNQISEQVDVLLVNLHDITGEQNRAYLASVLRQTDEMIERQSPKMDKIATNLENASGKIGPFMADLRATTAKVDTLIAAVQSVVAENRPDLRASLSQLSQMLKETRELMTQLNVVITTNSDNLDETMENIRVTSQNLRQLSDTLKQRPFSLVRVVPKPERQVPGAGQKSSASNPRRPRATPGSQD